MNANTYHVNEISQNALDFINIDISDFHEFQRNQKGI